MDDLIRRQDAIDAMKRWQKFPDYNRGERNVIACVIAMLEELPSAEHHKLNIAEYIHDQYPDVWRHAEKELEVPSAEPEITRCKDCKYGSPNGKYGCSVYHYRRYETHDMEPDDFCSRAERRTDE